MRRCTHVGWGLSPKSKSNWSTNCVRRNGAQRSASRAATESALLSSPCAATCACAAGARRPWWRSTSHAHRTAGRLSWGSQGRCPARSAGAGTWKSRLFEPPTEARLFPNPAPLDWYWFAWLPPATPPAQPTINNSDFVQKNIHYYAGKKFKFQINMWLWYSDILVDRQRILGEYLH
jgi:hypothetical protein